MSEQKRVIVALSGASGIPYGVEALRLLRRTGRNETHRVISNAAARTPHEETDLAVADVEALADVRHSFRDIAASIASGLFKVHGMLAAAWSARTLGSIATSRGDNRIVRAADVCPKERRRLVPMLRATPPHLGHIELMAKITRYGAIVMPPVPALSVRPPTVADLILHTTARALDVLDIEVGTLKRWPTAASE